METTTKTNPLEARYANPSPYGTGVDGKPIANPNPTGAPPTLIGPATMPQHDTTQFDTSGRPIPGTGASAPPSAPSLPVDPIKAATDTYYASLPKTFGASDESAIRDQVARNMQAQVDAVNVSADQLRRETIAQNQQNEGRVRGLNVSANLSGSDFATSAAIGVEKKGEGALRAVEDERSAKIGLILSNIASKGDDLIEARRKEAQGNAKAYVDHLASVQESTKSDVANLAAAGADLEKVKQSEYWAHLKEQTGMDDAGLELFYNSHLPKPLKVDYQYKMEGNKLFAYGIDPKDGTMKTVETTLGFDVPKNFTKTVDLGDRLMIIPDNFDPSKDTPLYYNKGQSEKDQVAIAHTKLLDQKLRQDINQGAGGKKYSFSNDDRGKLIAAGVSNDNISALQENINKYGSESVLGDMKDLKLKTALQGVLGGKSSVTEPQFLTKEFLQRMTGDSDVQELLTTVNLYREANLTDKEIFKEMQKQ